MTEKLAIGQRVAIQSAVHCSVPECTNGLEAQAVVSYQDGKPVPVDYVENGTVHIGGVVRDKSRDALVELADANGWEIELRYVLCPTHKDSAAYSYLRAMRADV